MMIAGDELFSKIPLSFKIWLILPMVATFGGLYNLYHAVLVWKDALCHGLWARIRYSIVTVCALFMCWFYYFWNLFGFQYFS